MAQTGQINLKETLKTQGIALDNQGNRIDFMHYVMLAMIIVLFVGFAQMFIAVGGILIDSWTHKSESYENLTSKVNLLIQQNEFNLSNIKDERMLILEQQISDLKFKNPYLK